MRVSLIQLYLILSIFIQAGYSQELPVVQAITQPPNYHWFGYYDKWQFDPTDRFVLGMEVDFEGRSPTADDRIQIGMIDLLDGCRWIDLGVSNAWGWQQGCMLQWRPNSMSEVVWNDREGDRFVCRILDVFSREMRTVPYPIYSIGPDGRQAVTTDFRRIQDTRPGYGYAGLPDPHKDEPAPNESGIWVVDLESGEAELIISLAQIVKIPHPHGEPGELENSKHWFNHLLFNTDGTRFIFLHRWKPIDPSKYKNVGGFGTRMLTSDLQGSDIRVIDPYGKTSHFIWRDATHILAWAWHPSHDNAFYLYRDGTDLVDVVGKEVMAVNGHCTYLPHTDNEWILNDTYPDRDRNQEVYLYHIPSGRKVSLGRFYSPEEYRGEWRCDTHPRYSRDGRFVVIDSPHGGNGRQMYRIDIGHIVGPR